MTQANKPHIFSNDTNADAEQVNANFDEIYSKYNGHDGSSANIHGVGTSGFASQNDIDDHSNLTTGVHGVSGSNVASEGYVNSYADAAEQSAKDYADTQISNSLNGYEIQVDGTDGQGIINFKTV